MRNFFATFFIVLFVISLIILMIVGNLYLSINKPAKVKTILETSGVYDTVAYYIRQNIVEENQVSLDQSKALEDLNESISAQSIKLIVDQTIDRIYKAIDDPQKENLKFEVRFVPTTAIFGQDIIFEKKVNLTDNPIIYYLSKISIIFSALIFICILWLSLALLTAKGIKFKWLASALLIPGIIITFVTISLYFMPQQYLQFLANKINFVKDPILLNGLRRVVESLVNSMKLYFILESVVLIILVSLFYYLGSFSHREKLEFMNIGKIKKQDT